MMEKEARTNKAGADLDKRNRNWEKISTHLADSVTQEGGVHGIRIIDYSNLPLGFLNGWVSRGVKDIKMIDDIVTIHIIVGGGTLTKGTQILEALPSVLLPKNSVGIVVNAIGSSNNSYVFNQAFNLTYDGKITVGSYKDLDSIYQYELLFTYRARGVQ